MPKSTNVDYVRRNITTLNNYETLVDLLQEYNIEPENVCIVASGVLHVTGIRDNGDIDILVRKSTRKRILDQAPYHSYFNKKKDGKIEYKSVVEVVQPNRYRKFGISDDDIISDSNYHFTIDGYKFVRPELVLSKKWVQSRPKDMKDVALFENSNIMDSDTWKWNLVFAVPPWEKPGNRPAYVRFIDSLMTYGIQTTIETTIDHVVRNIPRFSIFSGVPEFKKATQFLDWMEKHQSHNVHQSVPLPYLLANQYADGQYNAWDTIARAAYRNNIIHHLPTQCSDSPRFQSQSDTLPTVTSDLRIAVETEKLQEKLVNQSYFVECNINPSSEANHFSKDDLKTHFDGESIRDLETYKNELFMQTGVYFFAIVWPPARQVTAEIQDILTEGVNVVRKYQTDFFGDWLTLTRDIYSVDRTVRDWTVRKKAEDFNQRDSSSVSIYVLECSDPSFEYEQSSPYSSTVSSLKDKCRMENYEMVDNYFYDNIIHMTDNYDQNRHMYKTLCKHNVL